MISGSPSGVHLRGFEKGQADFRLLIENIMDYSILMLDIDGYIQSWNSGAERIQGYKADEIVGKHFRQFYTPEDIERKHPEEELQIALREGRFEEEGWRVRKDGTRFWVNAVVTPLRDDNSNVIGFAKITRDLTERKRAEDALKKAYDDLESFSYSVSHDLRAPLRSMDGFSEVLMATLGEKIDEKSRNYLERIRASSQKMSHLIDGLLDLARLGRAPLVKRKVDLSQMAFQVAAELEKDRSVDFKAEPSVFAQGDEQLLRVVLENLLSNAWKYTLKTPKPQIQFGTLEKSRVPIYFVRDNGVGFEMEFKDKLFGAFQRLHSHKDFPGNGIGLATVKRIIHRHGGDVWAEGSPGEGATFYFTVQPLLEWSAAEPPMGIPR